MNAKVRGNFHETILIVESGLAEPVWFATITGDYSHLDGKFIGSSDISEQEENELAAILQPFHDGELEKFSKFPVHALRYNPHAKVIVVGQF